MKRELSVSGSIHIKVDPETVYDAVSDVRQMGRWSPENKGAAVRGGFESAYVRMTFVGDNQRGPVRWQTRCTVTAADRGKVFAFDVDRYGIAPLLVPVRIASWEYTFDPAEGGTFVTETWRDGRTWWPAAAVRVFDAIATRHRSFADFQRGNIRRTLARLKAELERDTTG